MGAWTYNQQPDSVPLCTPGAAWSTKAASPSALRTKDQQPADISPTNAGMQRQPNLLFLWTNLKP